MATKSDDKAAPTAKPAPVAKEAPKAEKAPAGGVNGEKPEFNPPASTEATEAAPAAVPEPMDPETALKSALEAPGHAVGDSIPLVDKAMLLGAGFRPIGIDKLGRAWAVEEIPEPEKNGPFERLVFVGRLET